MRYFFVTVCTLLWSILLLSGCHSKNPTYPPDMDTLIMNIPAEQQGGNDSFDIYHITAGDILEVFFNLPVSAEDKNFTISVDNRIEIHFLNAPELDQNQVVRPDGMISMPYIGQVKVSGKKVGKLTTLLEKKYATILREPELFVVLSEFRNRVQTIREDLRTSDSGLSRKLSVRSDGYTTLPYLGEVAVVGRTLKAVNEDLNSQYDAFLPGLKVDLSLDEQSGSLVYVLGEVNKPGAYKMHRPITALEAVTLAGGYKSSAKLEQVVALRRSQDQVQARRIDLVNALTLQEGQYFLKPADVLFVPKSTFYANSEIATTLTNILLFRGWGFNYSWTKTR